MKVEVLAGDRTRSGFRGAGWGLVVLALGSVALMAAHPTSGTHDFGEFVTRVGRGIPGNTFVHGSLITATLLMALCFLWLRDLLGGARAVVRAGTVALVVGTAGMVAAGLVNGFIVPKTAAAYVAASGSEIESLKPVLVLAREANATFARVGILGLSLATIAWSIGLLMIPGWRRAAGGVGLACGLVPVLAHGAEHLRVDVSGFSMFVQAHAVWAGVAGVVLIRHRAEPKGAVLQTEEEP